MNVFGLIKHYYQVSGWSRIDKALKPKEDTLLSISRGERSLRKGIANDLQNTGRIDMEG